MLGIVMEPDGQDDMLVKKGKNPGDDGFLAKRSILDFFKASPKGIEEGESNPLCIQPSIKENGQNENIHVEVCRDNLLDIARKKRKADDTDEDITESEVEKKTSRKEKKDHRGKKQKLTKMVRKADIFDEKESELGIESSQQETVILNVSDDKSKANEDSIICLSDASINDTLDATAKEKLSEVSLNGSKVEKGKVVQGLVSSSELHIKEGKSNFTSEEEQDEDKMIDLSNSDISLPDCRGENGDQLVLISSTPVRHRKTESVSIGSSKKNLKGKDMLNLLKEIQKDGESEKNKGKKKKPQKNSETCSLNSATNRETSREILADESTSVSLKHENKEHESTAEHIASKKNTGREKKKTDDELINTKEVNVMQLSFSEYLDSISCLDQGLSQGQDEDNNSTLFTQVNTMKNEKTTKNSTKETNETETSLRLEMDTNKASPDSKTRPIGIAKFFTKTSTPFRRNEEANSLTIKAVVHPEPSPPKIEVTSIDHIYDCMSSVTTVETVPQKRGRRRQKDDRIEFLSTEIINIDEIEPVKMISNLDKSHSDDTREPGKSENTTQLKEKGDSLTEKMSEVQKGENERKITFLKSPPKSLLPEKTSQPTLCFGKSGLTLTKPSSTRTTRVRKPHDGEEKSEKERYTQMGTDKKREMTPAKKHKSESQTPNKKKNPEGKTPFSKHEGVEQSLGKKIRVESETDTNDNQDDKNLTQSSKFSKKDKTGMKTSTPGRSGRGRKPSVMKCDHDIDSLTEMSCVQTVDDKASTPRRSRRGRKPLTAKDDSIDVVAEVVDIETVDVEMAECEQGKPDNLEDEISERRQSLRKRYMVTGFQMDEEKKTPIKIKLKRYAKSSSGEDSLFTPNSAKRGIKAKTTAQQTHAQKLLEKAKQHKSGMKSRETKISQPKGGNSVKKNRDNFSRKVGGKSFSIVDSMGRKSARLANKPKISMEELIILDIESESEEEDEDETIEPIKKKGKRNTAKDSKGKPSSPKKPGSQKSPKKCGTPRKNDLKLAPIFNKKVVEKNLAELPPIDPEKLRLRNEFLHSGLPDELKRQSAVHTAILCTDYPPFLRPNHVQQILDWSKEKTVQSQDTTGLNVWDLPKVDLKLRDLADTAPEIKSISNSLNLYRNVETISDLSVIKNFSGHLELKVEHLDACLAEIQSFNPSCPVKRMYNVLKEMKSKSDNSTQVTGQSVLPEAHAGSSLKRQCSSECYNADEMATSKTTRKRRNRHSSSKDRKIESQDVGNREAPKEEDKDKLTTVTLPWTEKYQPCKAFDILGNSNNLKRLKSWLTEWKQRVDRETRKAKKLLLKQSKGKKTSEETAEAEKDDLWGDDSDFNLDSDDSEGEDNSLCNTMLITGPHGIGKTASVYALAQELGFKVFEVNASSSRSGKKILSQLQEATQSHQVSHNKEMGTPAESAIPAVNVSSEPSSKGVGTKHSVSTTKMPSVFANFFKKEVHLAPTSQQSSKKTASAAQGSLQGRKRNRDKIDSEEVPQQKKSKKVNSSPTKVMGTAGKKKKDDNMTTVLEPGLGAKGLNLTSTSLILFDEVDVVFEEDKGFLAAIQTFMNSTKIPIIMITAQASFAAQFEGRFEELTFKLPSPLSIASHLQVICLVENLRTDFEDLLLAVQFNSCDIRRCMLGLQFWVESGGGIHQCNRPIRVSDQPRSTILLQVSNESQDTLMGDSQTQEVAGVTRDLVDDDDDDFVIANPVRIRSRRLIDEDQSNTLDGVAAFDKLRAEKTSSESQQAQSKAEEEEKDLPKVHSLLVDSQINTSALIQKSLFSTIKTSLQTFPTSDLLEICARYRENRCDVLYSNLAQLLPLPRIVVDSLPPYVPKSETSDSRKPKRRRIKSDLFDSEGSDEEIQGDYNNAMKHTMPSSDDTQDNQAKHLKLDTSDKSCNIHVQKSLHCFADYYDTMSLLDVMDAQMECKDLDRLRLVDHSHCRLLDGIDDDPSKFEQQRKGSISQHQLGSELEVRSFHKFYCEIDSIQKKLENFCENSTAKGAITLSVLKGQDKFAVSVSPISSSSLESRIPSSIKRCMDNVLNNLPLTVHNHHSNLSLDYLPLLQVISRSEQCRHLAKTKRRFHHYLDSIGMPLKESTLNVLASSFS